MSDENAVEVEKDGGTAESGWFKTVVGAGGSTVVAVIASLLANAEQIASASFQITIIAVAATSMGLCIVALLRKRFTESRRRVAIAALLLAVTGAALGFEIRQSADIGGLRGTAGSDQRSSGQGSEKVASAHLAESMQPLPACSLDELLIEGGAPRDGWVYIVGQRDEGTQRIYFVSVERESDDKWAAKIPTGKRAAQVWLLAVDADWAGYLLGSEGPSSSADPTTKWSSARLPPRSVPIDFKTFRLGSGC